MATTAISWGDGSGDNLYLTYPSASGDQTLTVTSDANAGYTDRTISITFTASHHGTSSVKILTITQEGVPESYIVFADPAVEQICATKWGDGVGLKPSQAAKVTNSQFGTTFRANTNITSFDELSYFTGLTQVPGGATSSGAFYGCTALKSVTFSPNVETVSAYAFQGCSNLLACPDLTYVKVIGRNAFYNCAKIGGTVTIPSTVTQLNPYMFAGCIAIKDLIINTTVYLNTQYVSSTTDALSCGNGTGTFYCAGNFSNNSNYRVYFRKFIIGGNYSQTGGSNNPWRCKVVSGKWPTEVFVVKGNYSTNGSNAGSSSLIKGATNGTSSLKFIEIMGTITSSYCILGDMNNFFIASSVILHLGYDAYTNGSVVCSPGIVGASNSRVSKIYVGKGQSAEEDNNILSVYTSNSSWSSYSSKLDTWYNYINSSGANRDYIN